MSLTNAARRLYVGDGSVILTIEDLIQWTTEFYRKRFEGLSKANQRSFCSLIGKELLRLSLETALLDRVELNTPVPRKSK